MDKRVIFCSRCGNEVGAGWVSYDTSRLEAMTTATVQVPAERVEALRDAIRPWRSASPGAIPTTVVIARALVDAVDATASAQTSCAATGPVDAVSESEKQGDSEATCVCGHKFHWPATGYCHECGNLPEGCHKFRPAPPPTEPPTRPSDVADGLSDKLASNLSSTPRIATSLDDLRVGMVVASVLPGDNVQEVYGGTIESLDGEYAILVRPPDGKFRTVKFHGAPHYVVILSEPEQQPAPTLPTVPGSVIQARRGNTGELETWLLTEPGDWINSERYETKNNHSLLKDVTVLFDAAEAGHE